MNTRLTGVLLLIITALCSVPCSQRKQIDALAEQFNSPAFRAAQAGTGLFDDTKADVDGDCFTITFLCRPFMNLSAIDQSQYSELEQLTVCEFQKRASIDAEFHKGLEALAKEKMIMMLVWQDVNGATIRIAVDPVKILKADS